MSPKKAINAKVTSVKLERALSTKSITKAMITAVTPPRTKRFKFKSK